MPVAGQQASGATGPATFPVNTPWNGAYLGDNENWYYALYGISHNQTGPFTVTDEQLAKLHRKGLAQEYTAMGTSDDQNTSGGGS